MPLSMGTDVANVWCNKKSITGAHAKQIQGKFLKAQKPGKVVDATQCLEQTYFVLHSTAISSSVPSDKYFDFVCTVISQKHWIMTGLNLVVC